MKHRQILIGIALGILIILIALVAIVAAVSAFWHPQGVWRMAPWWVMISLSMIGAVLPTWMFLQVQPHLSNLLGSPVSAGMGLGLNIVGNMFVFVAAFSRVIASSRPLSSVSQSS